MNWRAAVAAGAVLLSFASLPSTAAEPQVAVVIRSERLQFAPGERFPVTIEVKNQTSSAIRFTFLTSQRYELTLENASGGKLWRWSQGRFFLQSIGQVVLKPNRVGLRMKATIPAPTQPGRYTLRAILASSNHPLEAESKIVVR